MLFLIRYIIVTGLFLGAISTIIRAKNDSVLNCRSVLNTVSELKLPNYDCAIAMQTILILAPGIFNNAREQASRVAPVVITSSIKRKCLL